jgi:hypothetical protein
VYYWSRADAATYVTWLREIGFSIQRQDFIPEDAGGRPLLLTRKP